MAWSSIISDAMWLYPEGSLWDDAYKNNPRPHKLASKHTHLYAQYRQFINENFQSFFFWRKFPPRENYVLEFREFICCSFYNMQSCILQIRGVVPRIKYITRTLQWIGVSESLDDSNRSSNHTAWEEGKQAAAVIAVLLHRKEKTLKVLNII